MDYIKAFLNFFFAVFYLAVVVFSCRLSLEVDRRRAQKVQAFEKMTIAELLQVPESTGYSDNGRVEFCNMAYWRKVRELKEWTFSKNDLVECKVSGRVGSVAARYVRGGWSADANYSRKNPVVELYKIKFPVKEPVVYQGADPFNSTKPTLFVYETLFINELSVNND